MSADNFAALAIHKAVRGESLPPVNGSLSEPWRTILEAVTSVENVPEWRAEAFDKALASLEPEKAEEIRRSVFAADPKAPLEVAMIDDLPDQWKAFHIEDCYAERPEVEFLIPGLFAIPSVSIVYGPPGSLKSMILADLAVCVAGGLPWLPAAPWLDGETKTFPTKAAPVIWADFDNGTNTTLNRFEALGKAHGLPADDKNLIIYTMPRPWLDISDPTSIAELTGRIIRAGAKMVVIDNLGLIKGDADENSDDMAAVMSAFRQIAEAAQCAIVLIHHQRKSNGMKSRAGDSLRGHSSIEAAIDLALLIEREEYSDTVNLRATKIRGADVLPFSACFTFETKPDRQNELSEATFFSVTSDDVQSNRAIDAAIKTALEEGELNKTKLTNAVKESLPEIGLNRIRNRIDRLAGEHSIKIRVGERRGERIYSL